MSRNWNIGTVEYKLDFHYRNGYVAAILRCKGEDILLLSACCSLAWNEKQRDKFFSLCTDLADTMIENMVVETDDESTERIGAGDTND